MKFKALATAALVTAFGTLTVRLSLSKDDRVCVVSNLMGEFFFGSGAYPW